MMKLSLNGRAEQYMSTKVNLDALIPREDFEVADEAIQHQPVQTLQIRDLESEAFFYSVYKKAGLSARNR